MTDRSSGLFHLFRIAATSLQIFGHCRMFVALWMFGLDSRTISGSSLLMVHPSSAVRVCRRSTVSLDKRFPLHKQKKTIRDECYVDLRVKSVRAVTIKSLDMQMLLHPLEEQFNVPAVTGGYTLNHRYGVQFSFFGMLCLIIYLYKIGRHTLNCIIKNFLIMSKRCTSL